MKALISVLIMASITYLIRFIPVTFCKKKIKSRFLKSFLYYVPYAVLAAMTFPSIFYCTDNNKAAIAGTIVAVILAFMEKSLVTVALFSVITIFIISLL